MHTPSKHQPTQSSCVAVAMRITYGFFFYQTLHLCSYSLKLYSLLLKDLIEEILPASNIFEVHVCILYALKLQSDMLFGS